MVHRFSNQQFVAFERKADQRFEKELDAYLEEAFEDVADDDRRLRLKGCREHCDALGITSEYGITCYCFLSFMLERPLAHEDDFLTEHQRYQLKYGSADQLPIDLYERLEPRMS